ncbi:MAG: hypothetical protein MUC50_23425 [Myxococcota bacterium]|nr:hypothetical protein [Myxococcota bacterium]
MKNLLTLMGAALFAVSTLACGDEEAGNACEQLQRKLVKSFDDFCEDHSDCKLVCGQKEPTDSGNDGEEIEPTEEELEVCQNTLDHYSYYEHDHLIEWINYCN